MPRAMWPLHQGRPRIDVVLARAAGATQMSRSLLADTGAGSQRAVFELVLEESVCLACGGIRMGLVQLAGAYTGPFPIYSVRVLIPQIGFGDRVRVVGVSTIPPGLDGVAGFRFLNRFTYGNLGRIRA